MRLTESGVLLAEPRVPFLALAFPLAFAIGIGLSFAYAAMRKQLGPGPKTALALGAVAFLLLLPSELFHGAWTHMTPEVVWGAGGGTGLPGVWVESGGGLVVSGVGVRGGTSASFAGARASWLWQWSSRARLRASAVVLTPASPSPGLTGRPLHDAVERRVERATAASPRPRCREAGPLRGEWATAKRLTPRRCQAAG
jgi:hypothetical protein